MNTTVSTGQVPAKSIANFLNAPSTAKFLQDTLAEKKSEFVSNLIALCDADSKIAACDPAALMKCAMNATALNLPLNKNLGLAYIVPYKNKDGNLIPQFQIGYKGFIQLGIRTGYYRYINAVEVRKGEIERNKITGEIKLLAEYPDNEIIGYIAYLELQSGFRATYYMSIAQIEEHALRFSQAYRSDKKNKTMVSKWSDPDARPVMCKKTVLKMLLGTYGLITTEFSKAFDSDNDDEDQQRGERYDDAVIVSQPDPQPIKQPDPISNDTKTIKI